MRTVAETEEFQKQADKLWSESERLEFVSWLALNPTAGDVIPGTGGCRKVRWARQGMGKQGGVRIVYFNFNEAGVLLLLAIYAKSAQSNISARDIKKAI
jgi:hypothetical protein